MALHLKPESQKQWLPKVLTTSALSGTGLDAFWNKVVDYKEVTKDNWKQQNREDQMIYWTKKSVKDILLARLGDYSADIEQGLKNGELPEVLAKRLLG